MGLDFHGVKGGLLEGDIPCPRLFVMQSALPLWRADF